jgi:hypothetical protein
MKIETGQIWKLTREYLFMTLTKKEKIEHKYFNSELWEVLELKSSVRLELWIDPESDEFIQ